MRILGRSLALALVLTISAVRANAVTSITATSQAASATWGPTGSPADTEYWIEPTTGSSFTIPAGVTLTIQPGTTVRVKGGVSILVTGTLAASGTLPSPMRFDVTPAFSQWGGIRANSGGVLGLVGCTIRNFGTYPVDGTIQQVASLFATNTFEARPDGHFNAIQLRGSTIAASITLTSPPPSFCYFTAASAGFEVRNAANPVLTIGQNTVIKFSNFSYLRVGYSGLAGGLDAKGVVFTSSKDDTLGDTDQVAGATAPQQWEGLTLDPSTLDAQTVLDSCVIRYGGNGPNVGLALTDCEPTVKRCLLDSNFLRGMSLSGTATGANVFSNILRRNTECELVATPQAMVNVVPANTVDPSLDGRFNGYELLGGTIAASMTLPKPPAGFCYLTYTNGSSAIEVRGAANPVLTIADGTMIKFTTGSYLRVGYSGLAGGLRAKGVVFTSQYDDSLGDTNGNGVSSVGPQQWEGITLDPSTLDASTVLDSCIIRNGGNGPNVGIALNDCEGVVKRCLIDSNYLRGIGLSGTSTGLSVFANVLRRNSACEMVAPLQAMVNLVPNNTVEPSVDGRFNGYELLGATVSTNMTLPKPPAGFCYLTYTVGASAIEVRGAGGPVLTIAAGTMIKFTTGSYLRVGYNGLAGALRAKGVVFTSQHDDSLGDTNGNGATAPAPQQWEGITLDPTTLDALTELDSCIVRYGGNGPNVGIALNDCEPTVKRCLIASNYLRGISVTGTSSGANVFDNVFRDNPTYEIVGSLRGLCRVIPQNRFEYSGNGRYNGFEVQGGTVAADLAIPKPPVGMCYVFMADNTIAAGVTLSVPAGAVLKFTTGVDLNVQGRLLTDGDVVSPYDPVVFTSLRDDSWWGDTNGDAAASIPTAGVWGRVEFSGANNASQLKGAVFRYGGSGSLGQVRLLNTGAQTAPNVLIQDCFFDIDLASAGGIYSTGSSPRIVGCGFRGLSTRLGVQNTTAGVNIDATGNWWGEASGPRDVSASVASEIAGESDLSLVACVLDQNAGGLGVSVTDCVQYRPFLTVPSGAPVTDAPTVAPLPGRSALVAISPTPARATVTFTLDLAADSPTELELFDVTGRRLRVFTLTGRAPGRHVLTWNVSDDRGVRVGAGVYFARLRARTNSSVHRVVIVE